ncbi:MAG: hypothetical protein WBA41_06600 [Rivularia sp. (in: cyanobacteria)]
MSFWYNKKDDAKIATLACNDWLESNSKVEFNELGFTSDDTFYLIVADATKFTDVLKMGDKDFKISNEIVQFKVARKNYVKKDWKTKADVSITQSRVEEFVCSIFDNLNSELRYKGFINLQDGNYLNNLLTGKAVDGQIIPENMLEMMKSTYLLFEEIEESKITNDLLSMPASKGFSSYSKGQTEAEKIKDRVAFVDSQIKEVWEAENIESGFLFLVNSLMKGDDKAVYFMQVLEKLLP